MQILHFENHSHSTASLGPWFNSSSQTQTTAWFPQLHAIDRVEEHWTSQRTHSSEENRNRSGKFTLNQSNNNGEKRWFIALIRGIFNVKSLKIIERWFGTDVDLFRLTWSRCWGLLTWPSAKGCNVIKIESLGMQRQKKRECVGCTVKKFFSLSLCKLKRGNWCPDQLT